MKQLSKEDRGNTRNLEIRMQKKFQRSREVIRIQLDLQAKLL